MMSYLIQPAFRVSTTDNLYSSICSVLDLHIHYFVDIQFPNAEVSETLLGEHRPYSDVEVLARVVAQAQEDLQPCLGVLHFELNGAAIDRPLGTGGLDFVEAAAGEILGSIIVEAAGLRPLKSVVSSRERQERNEGVEQHCHG